MQIIILTIKRLILGETFVIEQTITLVLVNGELVPPMDELEAPEEETE